MSEGGLGQPGEVERAERPGEGQQTGLGGGRFDQGPGIDGEGRFVLGRYFGRHGKCYR